MVAYKHAEKAGTGTYIENLSLHAHAVHTHSPCHAHSLIPVSCQAIYYSHNYYNYTISIVLGSYYEHESFRKLIGQQIL